MSTFPRTPALWLFPLIALVILAVEWVVIGTSGFATAPDLLGLVVTLDIVVVIPLLGYFMWVRPRHVPSFVIAPLFLLCVALAYWMLPASGQQYLLWVSLIVPIIEIGFFLYSLTKLRDIILTYRKIRPTALYGTEALRQSITTVVGDSLMVRVIFTELSLLYYSFIGWFTRYTPTLPSHRAFSYHEKSGYGLIIVMIVGLSLIEAPLVHLVVALWNDHVAWVLTFLTIYSLFWSLGDYQAMRLHPIVIEEGYLHLRAGMRWHVSFPISDIQAVRTIDRATQQKKEYFDISAAGSPKILLELNAPVTIQGLFGMKRVSNKIGLAVDDVAPFLALVTPPPTAD